MSDTESKKRGRAPGGKDKAAKPPKSPKKRPAEDEPEVEEHDGSEGEAEAAAPKPAKRGRGRPPKAGGAKKPAKKAGGTGKRGRPKKNAS